MLAHEAARDAVVQEDTGIEVVVEVDRKGEAALADEDIAQRRGGICLRVSSVAHACALLAVLRASARALPRLGVDMLGRNAEHARSDGEDVEHAVAGQLGVDRLRCHVLRDDDPAPRCGLGGVALCSVEYVAAASARPRSL